MKNRVWTTWIAAGSAALGMCFTTFAAPTVKSPELKQYVEEIQTESVGLAMDVKDLSSRLSDKSEALSQAKLALVSSENERNQAMQAIQERIGILCANGGSDWLSEVLASGDISAALNHSNDLTEEDLQVIQAFSDALKAETASRMEVNAAQHELKEIVLDGEAKQVELRAKMAEDQQEIANYVKEIAASEQEETLMLEECREYQPYICQEALNTVFEKSEVVDMLKEGEAVDMVVEPQAAEPEAAAMPEVAAMPEETVVYNDFAYVDPYVMPVETTDLSGYAYADSYTMPVETTDLSGYAYADPYGIQEEAAETDAILPYGYADPYEAEEEAAEADATLPYGYADPYGAEEEIAETDAAAAYGYADPYASTMDMTADLTGTDMDTEYDYSTAYDTLGTEEEEIEEIEEIEEEAIDTSYMNPVATTTTHSDFLGDFTITAYCGCAQCCGAAGQPTASGVMPTAGRTCAMYGIDFGTQLMINGQVYTVEDRGTPYGHVDLYFNTHEEALAFGRQTAEVYQVY